MVDWFRRRLANPVRLVRFQHCPQKNQNMIKLVDLLKEVVDLYLPNELHSKDISIEVKEENKRKFKVILTYKDNYYEFIALPLLNPKRPSINFGDTDKQGTNLNLSNLLNSPHSPRILAAIFGLLRYWVDKYDIREFEYGAEGNVRAKLYDMYLTKHFPDFENSQEKYGEHILQIWTKK